MSHFTWANFVPFFGYKLSHVLYGLIVGSVLIVFGLLSGRALRKPDAFLPAGKFGLKGFFEVFVEQITKLSDSVIGLGGRRMVPFFCFLFLYIWIQNLLGLLPGVSPSTENINTTVALGFFSFLVYNYCGFKEHKLSYLKQYLGPVLIMAPLFLVIEILSHIFRPLSLGLRLFGNMKGDHMVIAIFFRHGSLCCAYFILFFRIFCLHITGFYFYYSFYGLCVFGRFT